MRVPKFLLPAPPKIGFWAQKRPNLAQNWHFWPNMANFGPFDLLPNQKTMQTSCLGGSSVTLVQKLLVTPIKMSIYGPKTAKFSPKYGFFAQSWHFWPIWSHARPKNNADKVPRWFFPYMGTITFASSHKKMDFWPKYWHILPIWSHARPKNKPNMRNVGSKTFASSCKN